MREQDDHCREQFYNLIIDSMAEGVFTLDADGVITTWNRSMEAITGYLAEEALGRTCDILEFSSCLLEKCPCRRDRCDVHKGGEGGAKECVLQSKDGRQVPVLKHARVVTGEGDEFLGIVETLTDLTELKDARRRAEDAARRLGEMHRLDNIIGKSRPMRDVFTAIRAASASDATILVQGESGTGKELVAGAIHFNSVRGDAPLVTVNCSALSESLLESELFGHVKGAFTGAGRDRVGRFEQAQGGTVFLDEIGELTPFMQVKLLRVLQERVVERVGESVERRIDVRIIAATHRDLYSLVREGRFREDLYYRLKVFPIDIPPLRNRREDIPLLAQHFMGTQNRKTGKNVQGATLDAMRLFMEHDWPGNVRELENAIEHAFVLCAGDRIDVADLPVEIRRGGACDVGTSGRNRTSVGGTRPVLRNRLDRASLVGLLEECDWNKAEVGRRLGVSRTAVWKYMKKWDIPLQDPGREAMAGHG